jgi:hypothetical protein
MDVVSFQGMKWHLGQAYEPMSRCNPCLGTPVTYVSGPYTRAKKVTKESTPRAARPSGPQSGREFSEGTSMCLPKTAHIVCAALAGFNPARLPRLNGGPKSQERKQKRKQTAAAKTKATAESCVPLPLPLLLLLLLLLLLSLGSPLRRGGAGG